MSQISRPPLVGQKPVQKQKKKKNINNIVGLSFVNDNVKQLYIVTQVVQLLGSN